MNKYYFFDHLPVRNSTRLNKYALEQTVFHRVPTKKATLHAEGDPSASTKQ
jgi:hypothetical protein